MALLAGQACLSWWSVVSPFGGTGSTAALLFVLIVAAVKAIWEDVKRHQEDKRMNTSITHRVNPDGAWSGVGRCSTWLQLEHGLALQGGQRSHPTRVCLFHVLAGRQRQRHRLD